MCTAVSTSSLLLDTGEAGRGGGVGLWVREGGDAGCRGGEREGCRQHILMLTRRIFKCLYIYHK